MFSAFSRTSYTSAAYAANPNALVRAGSAASTSGGTYATIRSVRKTAADDGGRYDAGTIGGGGQLQLRRGTAITNHVSPYATSYVAAGSSDSGGYHVYSKPASPASSKISYYACTPLVVSDQYIYKYVYIFFWFFRACETVPSHSRASSIHLYPKLDFSDWKHRLTVQRPFSTASSRLAFPVFPEAFYLQDSVQPLRVTVDFGSSERGQPAAVFCF